MLTPTLALAALLAADPLPPGAVARLGAARLRVNPADGVAFAPDGSLVATINVRDGLHLWDVAAGRFVAHLRTTVASTHLLFTPDGRHVVFEDRDGVGLWDVRDGTRTTIPVEGGEKVSITALAFAPGGRLAIGAHDRSRFKKSVRVLDRATGRELRRAETAGTVTHIAFAADGTALTAVDERGIAYHVAEGGDARAVKMFDDRPSNGLSSVLAAGGRYFVWVSGQGELTVRDTDTGRQVWSPAGTRIGAADVTPDGHTLVAATWPWEAAPALATYDLATGRLGRRDPLPANEWGAPRCVGDGRTIALLGRPLRWWDLAAGRLRPQPDGHTDGIEALAVTPDGVRVVSGDGSREVRGWDLATGQTVWRVRGQLFHVARDGRALAGDSWAGHVTVLDPATGRQVREIAIGGPPPVGIGAARLSADGRTAVFVRLGAVAGHRQVVVEEHDLAAGGKVRVVKAEGMDMPQAVAPDGRWVFGYCEVPGQRNGMMFDRLTGQTTEIAAPNRWSTFRGCAPDGRTVVWQTYMKTDGGPDPPFRCLLTFVEVATGRERLAVPVPTGGDPEVGRVEFALDGRAVAVVWSDGRVTVLDARTGGEFTTLAGTGSPVTALAFAANGRRLVTGHADTSIVVWNLAPPLPPATSTQLDRWWTALAGGDSKEAYTAVWALAGAADAAVPYVRDRLKPAGPPTEQTRKLVADLDAPRFAVREAASRRLRLLGGDAIPALRQALAANPSAEQRQRLRALLDAAERSPAPDAVRASRAVWALEAAGTAEARRLLEALAGGADGAPLTVEAREAVDRLRRR